jgi:hypothetical protein
MDKLEDERKASQIPLLWNKAEKCAHGLREMLANQWVADHPGAAVGYTLTISGVPRKQVEA